MFESQCLHKENIFNIGIKLWYFIKAHGTLKTRHLNNTSFQYNNNMIYRRKLSCFKSKTYTNVYVYVVTFNFPFGITMLCTLISLGSNEYHRIWNQLGRQSYITLDVFRCITIRIYTYDTNIHEVLWFQSRSRRRCCEATVILRYR